MGLSREVIEEEIAAGERAIKAHKDGLEIHELVLNMFKGELAKLPPKKEVKEAPKGVG